MKKQIIYLFIAAIALSLTSCSKDTETTVTIGPKITLIDSLGETVLDTSNFFVTPYLKITVTPASGTTLASSKIDVKVNGADFYLGSFSTVDSSDLNGLSDSNPVIDILDFIGLKPAYGTTITFVATFKDSKGNTSSASYLYNIAKDKRIIASNEIELGAQNNANIPYKFLGLANSFATYTAGANGTARLNSGSIDFVYYYGTNDNNALAAPANADGAKVVWATEISSWSRQNRTKFKATTISAADYDNIKNNSKVDDLFSGIDFTSGTTEKATLLNAGSVVSFQTVNGVKGLAKFSAVGADATGSTKVTLIIQN
ncbi:MAG: hypothetical protein WCI53_01855 [Bacteroidota bacterium]|jgi:hypothetical protein